jgi:hypothetical protein
MITNAEKERHEISLGASRLLADQAKKLAFDKRISYAEAAEVVRERHFALAEQEKCGFVPEEEDENYRFTSLEAAEKISDLAKKLMREKEITYQEAVDEILSNPSNAEVARSYAAAD